MQPARNCLPACVFGLPTKQANCCTAVCATTVSAVRAQVYGLPTLIVFKDGQEVAGSKNEGAVTKAILQKYIQKHVVAQVSA